MLRRQSKTWSFQTGKVPTTPDDPAVPANQAAWAVWERWAKPVLTLWTPGDFVLGHLQSTFADRIPGAAGQPAGEQVGRVAAVQVGDEVVERVVGAVRVRRRGLEDLCEVVDPGGAGGEPAIVERTEAAKVSRGATDDRQPRQRLEGSQVAVRAGDQRGRQAPGLAVASDRGEHSRASRRARAAGGGQREGVDVAGVQQHGPVRGAHDDAVEPREVTEAALQLLDLVVGLGHARRRG